MDNWFRCGKGDSDLFQDNKIFQKGRCPLYLGETKKYSKTIFTLIDDDNVLTELYSILKEEGINFEKKGIGIMFTIPVDKAIK